MHPKRSSLLALLLLCSCTAAPPVHPRALENNQLCTQYLGQNDLEQAEVYCDLGLQFSPQYADLWVNKGIIALRRNDTRQAKDHFIRAIRYNQEQAQGYNNLGYIYLRDKEYGKAHDNFQRALKVNPDYLEARYNLALTFIGLKQPQKAKKELMTIIAVNPNLSDPHHTLCGLLMEEGRGQEAATECSVAVQLSPDFDAAWLTLGNIHTEAGRFCEAKDAFTSCIEANAQNIQCRNNVAITARKCALLDPVIKEAKENREAQDTAPGLYALGKTFREKGLLNEEERAYRKCLKKDDKYAPCHYGLFEVFRETRRDKDMVTACRNFVKFAAAEDFPNEVQTCERVVSRGSP